MFNPAQMTWTDTYTYIRSIQLLIQMLASIYKGNDYIPMFIAWKKSCLNKHLKPPPSGSSCTADTVWENLV